MGIVSKILSATLFGGGGLVECLWIATLEVILAVLLEPSYHELHKWFRTQWSDSDAIFFVVLTVTIHESLYYGLNGLFMLARSKGWWEDYRIDRRPNQEPSSQLILKTLKLSAVSHWIVQPLTLWFLWKFFAQNGADPSLPLPPVPSAIAQIALAIFVNDTGFYWTHRLLHHPSLYKTFHKQHHEYIGTIGFAAEYSGPLESALSNQLPLVIAPILLGLHPFLWAMLLVERLRRTYEGHSGYAFEGTWLDMTNLFHGKSARYHDFHHTHNTGNFGGPYNSMWDIICDTQKPWTKFEKAKSN